MRNPRFGVDAVTLRLGRRMSAVPEAILDGLAARPDDVGVWEVLTDFLLEQDAPGAVLARCELELLRGISNPELLGALAQARARREKLPYEPWGGFGATWRCGFVVRLVLSLKLPPAHVREVLSAPAVRGLHHLVLEDVSGRHAGAGFWNEQGGLGAGEFPTAVAERLRGLLGAVTPYLRRFSLRLEERFMPMLATEQRDVLTALAESLPGNVERVDLSLGALQPFACPGLLNLAQRVRVLNLDGSRLPELPDVELIKALVATGASICLGGTGLSPRTLTVPGVEWLAPDVTAWLENEAAGWVTPLTPSAKAGGYDAASWPSAGAHLPRELLDGARVVLDGLAYVVHLK